MMSAMKPTLHVAAALAFAASLAAADPLDGLQFADGKSHTLDQFHGQYVVLVAFCAT
jgi:hypothetical protein